MCILTSSWQIKTFSPLIFHQSLYSLGKETVRNVKGVFSISNDNINVTPILQMSKVWIRKLK